MTQHPHASTASGGVVIERQHSIEGATYEESSVILVGRSGEIAGETEPILADPIDYDAELAKRSETHEAIELDPEVDISDNAFGI